MKEPLLSSFPTFHIVGCARLDMQLLYARYIRKITAKHGETLGDSSGTGMLTDIIVDLRCGELHGIRVDATIEITVIFQKKVLGPRSVRPP